MGYSVPRNKELMRIFKDLEMVEYLGSGVPRILRKYPRSIFTFTPNFIRITFPFEESLIGGQATLTDQAEALLKSRASGGFLHDIYVKQHDKVLGDMPDKVQKGEVRTLPEMKKRVEEFAKLKNG